jgi:hypothetical protein
LIIREFFARHMSFGPSSKPRQPGPAFPLGVDANDKALWEE